MIGLSGYSASNAHDDHEGVPGMAVAHVGVSDLPQIDDVVLSLDDKIKEEDWPAVRTLAQQAHHVKVKGNMQCFFWCFPSGGSFTNLHTLDLSGNKIGEDMEALAPVLSSLINLRVLDLGHNSISDKGTNKLASIVGVFTRLETLILTANDIGYDSNEEKMVALESLRSLLPHFPNIETLDLGYNYIYYGDLVGLKPVLGSLMNLQTLILDGNYIGEESDFSLSVFGSLRNLKTLSLLVNEIGCDEREMEEDSLEMLSRLESLDLRNNFITIESVAYILRSLPELKTLNFTNNEIQEEVLKPLAEKFPGIEIYNGDATEDEIDEEVLEPIADESPNVEIFHNGDPNL